MGDVTRRRVLQGAGVVAVAVPLGAVLVEPAMAAPRPLRRTFSPYVGQALSTRTPRGAAQLRLARIDDLPNARTGDDRRFSLVLQLRKGRGPAQGTWLFQHPQLGRFSMFVVPVSGKRGLYEAVFNAR